MKKYKIIDSVLIEAKIKKAEDFSTRIKVDNIANFNYLPQKVKDIIKASEVIRHRGFSEILGFIGRQVVWSITGHWKAGDPEFYAENFEAKLPKEEVKWDRGKLVVSPVKASKKLIKK